MYTVLQPGHTLDVGDVVRVGASGQLTLAEPAEATGEAIGVVGRVEGSRVWVAVAGDVAGGLTGLIPGKLYYLAAGGTLTRTAPTSGLRMLVLSALTPTSGMILARLSASHLHEAADITGVPEGQVALGVTGDVIGSSTKLTFEGGLENKLNVGPGDSGNGQITVRSPATGGLVSVIDLARGTSSGAARLRARLMLFGDESVGDAGSDLYLTMHADDGAQIGSPVLTVVRAAGGDVTWARPTVHSALLTAGANLVVTGTIAASDDVTAEYAKMGTVPGGGNYAYWAHKDRFTDTQYTLAGGPGGDTYLNGASLAFLVDNSTKLSIAAASVTFAAAITSITTSANLAISPPNGTRAITLTPAAARADTSNYLHLNAGGLASTTLLNAGALLFSTHDWGLDLGYVGSTYCTRLFCNTAGVIAFASTGPGPTAQSSFAHWVTIDGTTGRLTALAASAGITIAKTTGTTLVVSSTQASTSTTTGCVTLAGGLGVAGAIYAGGNILASVSGGVIKAGNGAGAPSVNIDGGAAALRDVNWQTNNSTRWTLRTENTAESGSDAGSNFALIARTDSAVAIDTVLSIVRAAGGAATWARPMTLSTASAGLTIAKTTGTTLTVSSTARDSGVVASNAVALAGGLGCVSVLALAPLTATVGDVNMFKPTWNFTANTAARTRGFAVDARTGTGAWNFTGSQGDMGGFALGVGHQNTGTLDSYVGMVINNFMSAAGTVTDWRGLDIWSSQNSGTITAWYGIRVRHPGGTVTTTHGLYIDAFTAGTTRYAIYTNDGLVRFGDHVDIATAAGELRVNGTKVVSARRTGWTAQTAAASRADLGAAPTNAALASFCRALYDDMVAHGLVGA